MKKFYEAPSAEELLILSADIMADSPLSTGSDESGSDLDWDLLD